MSVIGACCQATAWFTALFFGDNYAGIITAILLVDIGAQCIQISNQSRCLQQLPEATNRVNTIFMTLFFIDGSIGTLCAGLAWEQAEWLGVCLVGLMFSSVSLLLSAYERLHFKNKINI